MRLSSDEIGLWRRAMRDVIPLRGRAVPPVREPAKTAVSAIGAGEPQAGPTGESVPPKPPRPPPVPAAPLPGSLSGNFTGLDRASAERLRRGRYPIEARLDLHGMTQEEAHRALKGFVAGSRRLGRRTVLVITGHGRSSGGVLKSAVPRWLHEPDLRPHVLALTPARPQDGGSGALYLLLRKAS